MMISPLVSKRCVERRYHYVRHFIPKLVPNPISLVGSPWRATTDLVVGCVFTVLYRSLLSASFSLASAPSLSVSDLHQMESP